MSMHTLKHVLFIDINGAVIKKMLVENMSLVVRKPVFRVSDLVRHKPGCAATTWLEA